MTTSTIKGVQDIQKELTSQSGGTAARSGIKWDNFNYPVILRVMHYDISELEGSSQTVVRWAHAAFFVLLAGLATNCARACAQRTRMRL